VTQRRPLLCPSISVTKAFTLLKHFYDPERPLLWLEHFCDFLKAFTLTWAFLWPRPLLWPKHSMTKAFTLTQAFLWPRKAFTLTWTFLWLLEGLYFNLSISVTQRRPLLWPKQFYDQSLTLTQAFLWPRKAFTLTWTFLWLLRGLYFNLSISVTQRRPLLWPKHFYDQSLYLNPSISMTSEGLYLDLNISVTSWRPLL